MDMERQEFDLNEYSLEVRDGKAVVERKFKPGDVLCNEWGDVVIYAETKDDGRIVAYVGYCPEYRNLTDSKGGGWGYAKDFVYATGEEEKMLFAEIGKRGYVWDSEKKELRKKRWRAEMGEVYYTVCVSHSVYVLDYIEGGINFDDRCFETGNYFRTKEQAEKVAEEIRKVFEKYKEEQR